MLTCNVIVYNSIDALNFIIFVVILPSDELALKTKYIA